MNIPLLGRLCEFTNSIEIFRMWACGCPPSLTKYTNPETPLLPRPSWASLRSKWALAGSTVEPKPTVDSPPCARQPDTDSNPKPLDRNWVCYTLMLRKASESCKAATAEAVAAQAASNTPEPYKAATTEAVAAQAARNTPEPYKAATPEGVPAGRLRRSQKCRRKSGETSKRSTLWGGRILSCYMQPKAALLLPEHRAVVFHMVSHISCPRPTILRKAMQFEVIVGFRLFLPPSHQLNEKVYTIQGGGLRLLSHPGRATRQKGSAGVSACIPSRRLPTFLFPTAAPNGKGLSAIICTNTLHRSPTAMIMAKP